MKGLSRFVPAKLSAEVRCRQWYSALKHASLFNHDWYLAENADVLAAGLDPLLHYLKRGWKEMRDPSPEFSTAYYITRYPDIAGLDMPPLVHYWLHGRHEGRHFNSSLDIEWIKMSHLDEANADRTPSLVRDESLPYISVIIPTYNRLRLLPSVIDAWRAIDLHTSCKYELIFSDDGSEDGSVEYLENIQGLPIVVLKNAHGGASEARNAAIRVARGERLLIVGDDIYPDVQFVNVHEREARRLGRNVAILGRVDWAPDLVINHLMEHITEIGNEQFSYNRLPNKEFVDFRHFYTCNISVDRQLVLDQGTIFDGRFDEYGFEDIELGYRLSLKGMKIFYTEDAKGDHYHPYVVKGFCKRQVCSGRMAVTFRDTHPGVGHILGLDVLEHQLSKNKSPLSQAIDERWNLRIERLVSYCNSLEALVAVGNKRINVVAKRYLSLIYSNLFRAMYEYGALQKLSAGTPVLGFAMARNFGQHWDAIWEWIDSKSGPDGDFAPETLHEVVAVLLEKNQVAHSGQAPDLLKFIELAEVVSRQPTVLTSKRVRLQHNLRMGFYYLANNPRYLFRRLHEAVQQRGRSDSYAPVENLVNGKSLSELYLVIDVDNTAAAEIVERFRGVVGEDAPILWLTSSGHIVDENLNSVQISPVDCFFWPETIVGFPHRDHLLSAWMAVVENPVDLVAISYSLQNDSTVTFGSLRNQLVMSGRIFETVAKQGFSKVAIAGKIYRTLASPQGAKCSPIDSIFQQGFIYSENNSQFFSPGYVVGPREASANLPTVNKNRPVVFVFPIFVAVGGVERNTVEIIRKLEGYYDFVVITMERLRAEQGSLCEQFQQAGARVIEMSEIVSHPNYIRVLASLKHSFSPDLIWVCNGSPWFCDNAANLRSLFADVPVVDQEVYDVNEGWINRYHEPGIQSFDRFIAINQKIQQKFIGQLGMDASKIDLIYSAVDVARILEFKALNKNHALIREQLNLPAGKKLFTFVGRLTAQKRPLEFLTIAKARLSYSDEYFVLVGDGELAGECERFIEENGLSENVCRLPYVANTLELASVTEGLVITSAYEGLPIAMIEVLNFAVPVFSTDTGDIASVLAEYSAGECIPVDQSGDLRMKSFARWVSNLEAHRSSLLQYQDEILQRFSSTQISEQYLDCFNRASLGYIEQPK